MLLVRIMKHIIVGYFLLALPFFAAAQAGSKGRVQLIPQPVVLKENAGSFLLSPKTQIVLGSSLQRHRDLALLLAKGLQTTAGYTLPVVNQPGSGPHIQLLQLSVPQPHLGKEGYLLEVRPAAIVIKANGPAGWFYGMQTLLQLLPPTIAATGKQTASQWAIPCVQIEDYPRFQWRGLMLDVSRHFFSKAVILAYIDQMAKYKLNTFHFHLTDNQGWRIEIKSLPGLTGIGAWRVPRTGYWKGFKAPEPGETATDGGFYSQQDIREIVAYAARRFVTIIPEIDVPGHSLAMIAAYPNLSCTKQPQQVLAGDPWNVSRTNVLCVGNDSVFDALDKVMAEVANLFPGEYIHIGGDEVSRNYWEKCANCQERIKIEELNSTEELQTWFIKRVAKIVESKGKKAMGWYENLQGGMAPGMALMSWKNYNGGIAASQAGHKVVMTPAQHTYLDFYQGDPLMENGPFTVCRLSSCYAFEPLAAGAVAENVLGGQGSLWTEQVPNERKLQHMTWPRGMALAEVLWSPKEKRNWDDFIHRLETHLPRLDIAQVKYADEFYEPIVAAVKGVDSSYTIQITTEVKGVAVYYSFDDTSPDVFYPKYAGRLVPIPKGAHHLRAIAYRNGKPVGRELNLALAELIKRIPR